MIRQERAAPVEVATAVGNAIGAVAGIQHDEPNAVHVEGVEGLGVHLALAGDSGKELLLGEVVMVMVAEDMVARAFEEGEGGLHCVKIGD